MIIQRQTKPAHAIGIGGAKRYKKIAIKDLSNSDLLLANRNVLDYVSSVYQGVFNQYSHTSDRNRKIKDP
ncbi:MAG: hypothetical protein KC455_05555 [Carnobacterium sp.]|nr:hypothetical protein [Carnobacterium sp.]